MTNLFLIGACLALPYLLYAIFRTLRGRARVDGLSIGLAGIAVIVPVATLALNAVNATTEPLLTPAILANALLVLVVSAVFLILDYRKQERDLSRSYGTLGLGVSTLLLVGLFTTPLIMAQFSTAASASTLAGMAGSGADGSIVPASFNGQAANPGTAPVGQAAAGTGDSDLITAVESATGLSIDDVLTQLNAGTSLADLVTAHSGDLEAVTQALTTALDSAIAAGTLPSQMLERMGGDAATVAANALSGQVPPMILSGLLGGGMPAGGPPSGGTGDTAGGPPSDMAGAPPEGFAGPGATTDESTTPTAPEIPAAAAPLDGNADAAGQSRQSAAESLVTATPQADVTVEATEVEATKLPTPTPFLFDLEPTATPIVGSAVAEAEATTEAAATCSLVVNFNLNMRVDPNPDGPWMMTIPAYTSVTSLGHNADNWWQVTYDEQTGWVSGEYLTADRACSDLPVLD